MTSVYPLLSSISRSRDIRFTSTFRNSLVPLNIVCDCRIAPAVVASLSSIGLSFMGGTSRCTEGGTKRRPHLGDIRTRLEVNIHVIKDLVALPDRSRQLLDLGDEGRYIGV